MQSMLLPETAPGRPSSTAELESAIANGALAKDLKPTEVARIGAAGGNLAELGLSQDQVKALPTNAPEPTNAQLGAQGAAVKDFLTNAGGDVANLLGNPSVDGSTLGTVFPAKLGLNSDGSYKTATDGVNDMGLKSQSFAGPGAPSNGALTDGMLLAQGGMRSAAPSNQPSGPMPDQPPSEDVLTKIGRGVSKQNLKNTAAPWVDKLKAEAASNNIFAPGSATFPAKTNDLDSNPNFVRAPSAATPTYRVKEAGFKQTYILPTEANKMVSVTEVDGGKATPTTPNPKATTKDQQAWYVAATSGKLNGIKDGGDVAAVINGGYFNAYKDKTTMSFASFENGVMKSAGGIQGIDKNGTRTGSPKVAMEFSPSENKVTIRPWSENTGKRGEKDVRMQQSYESIASNAGLTSKDSNLIVGYAPDPTDNTPEARTVAATNDKGQVAFLVSQDKITQAQATDLLKKAGYSKGVIMLDTGASSTLNVKNAVSETGSAQVISDERRKIPNVIVLKK